MRVTAAVLDKQGGDAVCTLSSTIEKIFSNKFANVVLATPGEVESTRVTGVFPVADKASSVSVGSVSTTHDNVAIQVFKTQDTTAIFEGRLYPSKLNSFPGELFSKTPKSSNARLAVTLLKKAEGDFSLIVAEEGQLTAVRDPVGVQPLYFGENEAVAALASNRSVLWKLGITEPKSFPSGHVGMATLEGFRFKPVCTLKPRKPLATTMEDAASKLCRLLGRSVKRRIEGLREVVVAFSGGLDSSLVAFLAKKLSINVCLLHVSLERQQETEEAKIAAELLHLPLQIHLFNEAQLEKDLGKVIALIEEPDPVKASVGVPFYWNAQKAAAADFRTMLAGQGADELFGGYQRYLSEYISKGNIAVRKTMFRDVVRIHESNLERDLKICGYFDVELRLPFASFELADFAMSLPTKLKMEKREDSLRKLVLRRAARSMGLPIELAEKPKNAVQYSTGVSGALKKLAKKRKLTMTEYTNKLFLESKSLLL